MVVASRCGAGAPVVAEGGYAEDTVAAPLPPYRDPIEIPSQHDWAWANARLSIYGSAMLWSMAHMAVWPSPIPLFLLGLGLGWLAYRTQSLIGCIVGHALFNTVACLTLYWTTRG